MARHLEALLAVEQQETRPKWEERMESRMTDGPPWLQLPLGCPHLPLTIWIPQGTDQKAHAGLSLFCS